MHSLLERQIRRHLGNQAVLPPGWAGFIGAVEAAYKQADTDRKLIEHSLELMSQELTERNRALEHDLQDRQRFSEALQREKAEQAALIEKLEIAHHQLVQSEKMASIGQLAAGVAHEINNPVGFISSNVGTLERYLKNVFLILKAYERVETLPGAHQDVCDAVKALKEQVDYAYLQEDIFRLIDETRDGVSRVKKIVEDLKYFSHVDDTEWKWADLHKGFDSTLNVVWNELKYKAEVVKEYGPLPEVECLPGQINQVFMNLLVNAAHAIGERGTITIRTGTEDGGVWVEVADTGCGIAPENLKRVFDPFFTTKPVGKGTGLGLSLSYGIVQKHNGQFEVKSEIGKGATFRVHLPLKQPTSTPAPPDGTPG
jgi:two-component system, NtrC family, sensor kinase